MIPEVYKKHQSTENEQAVQNDRPFVDTGNAHYGDYHEWRLFVAEALDAAGYQDEAAKYLNCSCEEPVRFISASATISESGNAKAVYVCQSNAAHKPVAIFRTCQSRICPDCAKRESARLLARFSPKFQECIHAHHPTYKFRKIVLTTPYALDAPNAAQKYQELKAAIPKVFDRLLGKDWRKDQGFVRAAEFGPEGHKLHFHILFYGAWIDNRKHNDYPLSAAWKAVTGDECEIVHISAVNPEDIEHEVIETLKYSVKFWKKDADGTVNRLDPALMPVLFEVLKGTRRVEGYGIFYRLPPAPERERECPVCGAACERWSVTEWNIFVMTGWTPDGQKLNLRLADNSLRGPPNGDNSDPPNAKNVGPEPSETSQPGLVGLTNSIASVGYER